MAADGSVVGVMPEASPADDAGFFDDLDFQDDSLEVGAQASVAQVAPVAQVSAPQTGYGSIQDPREAVLLEAFRADPEGTLRNLMGGQQMPAQQPANAPDPYEDPAFLERFYSDPASVLREVEARARAQALAQMQPSLAAAANVSLVDAGVGQVLASRYEGTPQQMQQLEAARQQAMAQLRQTNPGMFSNPGQVTQTLQQFLDGQAFALGVRQRSQAAPPNIPVSARPTSAPGAGGARSSGFQVSADERAYISSVQQYMPGLTKAEAKQMILDRRAAGNEAN